MEANSRLRPSEGNTEERVSPAGGIFGSLVALLPWPVNPLDHSTESFRHAPVLILGLLLLREMTKNGELAKKGRSMNPEKAARRRFFYFYFSMPPYASFRNAPRAAMTFSGGTSCGTAWVGARM